MKFRLLVSIILSATSLHSADRTPRPDRDELLERGADPKQMHIEWQDGVARYPKGKEDIPARLYAIHDAAGHKKSGTVVWSYLPLKYEKLIFQWLDDQKYLVIINNRHKFFEVYAYARNRKGVYEALNTDVDSEEAGERMVRVLTTKVDPSLKGEALHGALSPNYRHVLSDSLKTNAKGLEFRVKDAYSERELDILYRFDMEKRKFIRLSTTLTDEDGQHKLLTVGEPEMSQELRK